MNKLTSSWSLLAVAAALLIAAAVRLWTDDEPRGDFPALLMMGAGLLTLGIWIGLETVRWITTGKGRPDEEEL